MDYIIMDLEWNQPMSRQSHPFLEIGERLPFEIFQIGAVKLSERMELIDRFEATIRLKQYKRLHYMVKKLTGANAAAISAGKEFEEEAARFRDWCGPEFVFVTWGYDDIPILKQNLDFYGLESDWCDRWYNLQVIFNRQLGEGKDQRSLEYAMAHFGIPADHQLHDALVDASYTAQVAQRLDFADGVRAYEESIWSMHPKRVVERGKTAVFPSRKAALTDPDVSRICCPVCGEVLSERIRWKATPDGGYAAEVACKTHGPFVGRLRFKRHAEGWSVSKVVRNTKSRRRRRRRKKAEPVPAPAKG